MSLRERVLIALGAIAVAGTVIVPVAYRLDTEILNPDPGPSTLPGMASLLPTPVQATPVAAASASTTPAPTASRAPHIVIAWATEASAHRLEIGASFSYGCPPNGPLGVIWGTGIYTDDSSICTAAVHHGTIAHGSGGTVTIVMRPGRDSYLGTNANGVRSESYPEWPGSYEFVPATAAP